MKKNKEILNIYEELNPEVYFEEILQVEADIANRIALITEENSKKIEMARKNLPLLRKSIIDDARSMREKKINEGIKKFEDENARAVHEARQHADEMIQKGKVFVDRAILEVFDFLASERSDAS